MLAAEYLTRGMPRASKALVERWRDVREQAQSHTQRGRQGRVVDAARPNRPESIKEYVISNSRNITMGEFRKVVLKLNRILRANDLTITAEGSRISEWLGGSPFRVLNQKADIWRWIYEVLIPRSLEDPNAIYFPWPEYNGEIPPAAPESEGGIPANESPRIKAKMVGSEKIRFYDGDTLVWEMGTYPVRTANGDREEPMYGVVSTEGGYSRLLPMMREDKIVYIEEIWYSQAFEESPLCNMPAFRAEINGEEYQESYAQSFFEYGDEFISSFSDNQAVRLQHAYPKIVIDAIPCPGKGCKNGKVITRSPAGVETKTACSVCGGAGELTNIDPFGVIRRGRRAGSNQGSDTPVVEYITPPTDILSESYRVAFDMLLKGKQVMGLDLLGQEAESGTAKLYRLEDLEDMIQAYATFLLESVTNLLASVEAILVLNPAERQGATYDLPRSFSIQDNSDLAGEMTAVPVHLRKRLFLAMVDSMHDNDEKIRRIYDIASQAVPSMLYGEEEIKNYFAYGLIDLESIWMRENAVRIASGMNLPEDDSLAVSRLQETLQQEYERNQGSRAQTNPDPLEG